MTQKINYLIDKLPRYNWRNYVKELRQITEEVQYDNADVTYIANQLKLCIQNKRINKSQDWLLLGLIIDELYFIEKAKKSGLFRASKYDFESTALLINIISKTIKDIALSDDILDYFKTLQNLYTATQEANSLRLSIITSLKQGKEKFLRDILINVDFIFMTQATDGWTNNVEKISTSLIELTPEVISEAASYILHLFNEQFNEIGTLDLSIDISRCDTQKALINAAKIRSVIEFEIMIDFFDYKITKSLEDNYIFDLSPPSEGFEKALRLGYIQNEIQQIAKHVSSDYWNKDGLKEFSEKISNQFGDNIISMKTDQIERYVLEFPFWPPVEEIINSEVLFPNEACTIDYSSYEWGISPNKLLEYEIADGVLLWDLVKAQRLVNFFRWILVSYMKPHLQNHPDRVFQSLLPVFTAQNLRILFDSAIGKDSQSLIDFLSYDQNKGGVLDLQYQPLIKIKGEYYALPYNLMANSAILRNSIQMSKRRFYEDGTEDPLSQLMDKALSRKTSMVASNIKYKWKDYSGEIDNIALIDNYLFIFECKNSHLPCSPHEAKTSYDYIIKAASQLERFKKLYQSIEFRSYLSNKLEWKISDEKLVTCIIISNRMFLGYRINGHVVRGSWETVNYIDSGIVKMAGEEKCFWVNSEFQGKDLHDFVEKDILHAHLYNALVPSNITYSFGKHSLKQMSYIMDMGLVAKNFNFVNADKIIEEMRNNT